MDLLIIRHGLPLRVENDDGSAADPHLAPNGVAQAQRLAAWLADERLDALYASPMNRARETAQPASELLGLPLELRDGVAEWDRDSAAYIPLEEMKAAKDGTWEAFLRGELDGPRDAAEFSKHVVDTIEGIVSAHRGQRVAVVCHGGVINAYCAYVLGLAPSFGFFHPQYTSINRVVAASSGERSIFSLNEIAHLRGSGLLSAH